jgi:hypothetical protein
VFLDDYDPPGDTLPALVTGVVGRLERGSRRGRGRTTPSAPSTEGV